MERLRVGVVGAGVMGERHARIDAALPEVALVSVCDVREDAHPPVTLPRRRALSTE